MGVKRTHAQMDNLVGVHASRQQNLQGTQQPPHKKPRKAEPATTKRSSVNPLKKRIRDLSRRLERCETLPADVRVENERALAGYKQELSVADDEKRRQKMIKKYHMIRFFERQKATRRLKKLQKHLPTISDPNEARIIEQQIHITEVDLNYTRFCPLDQKYTSLYPPKDSDEEGGKSALGSRAKEKEKPPLWKEVEQRMNDGTLNKLRNGVSHSTHPKTASKRIRKDTSKESGKKESSGSISNVKGPNATSKQAEEEESDGGFFE
ncbi:MAG: 18S rRNA maturation protein [Pycnora praestabilis]|nr:MAG: 18S rRNA maturation protein [Pycnora praestabilis]